MGIVGEIQNKLIKYNHEYFALLSKISLISDEELTLVLNGKLDVFINYGCLCREFVKCFGLYDYIGCADSIYEVWDRVKNGERILDIQVNKRNLFQYMYEISELVERRYITNMGKCPLCGEDVYFLPISNYFTNNMKRYNTIPRIFETLNTEEYACPACSASDRDRLMVLYLSKQFKNIDTSKRRLLHIAPSSSIENWLDKTTKGLSRDTLDLYMDNVTYKEDIQEMKGIADNTYDYVICSHVLEHVENDCKAFSELRRIIKEDGQIIFLVPIALDIDEVDEEWGLTSEENWRRFGQDDHSRIYSKQGLINRIIESNLCIESIDINYFDADVFKRSGITNSSTLYILRKKEL